MRDWTYTFVPIDTYACLCDNRSMSTNYKRRNRVFEARLAVRRDARAESPELRAATVTIRPDGRIVISALPAGYSFATREDAIRFLRRVTSRTKVG
jgi:hypothetical protein